MSEGAENGLRAAFLEQLEAMKLGDTQRLTSLLDAGFTLTHITGYRQPKSEWLAQMRSGQFRYHDIREVNTRLEVNRNNATVTGRIITDATVYGTRANWRLQLAVKYARVADGWIALQSIATTW